jgi:chromosome segregation ATPase
MVWGVYIFELASYLVVAILFGILAGWLIWGDEPLEAAPVADSPGSEQAVTDLAAQVETRDQEIVRLRKRLKRMHADMDARDLHLNEAKAQYEELQSLLSQRESELAAALNGDELPEGMSDVQTRRVSELEELLAASRSEADGLARKLQESMAYEPSAAADPALAERVAELETELANISQSRTSLQSAHAQLEAAHSQLERSHAVVSNDLAEAQARLDELSSGATLDQHDRVRVLEAEVERLRAAAASAEARVAELDNGNRTLLADLDAREAAVADLQARLVAMPTSAPVDENMQLELAKAQAELARSRQNVQSLRQRLQDVEDENESLAGDLARATTELQGRSSKTSEVVAERDQLRALQAQIEAEKEQLRGSSAELEAELQRLRVQHQELSDALREAQGRAQSADELSGRADLLQRRSAELESALQESASQAETLSRQLEQVASERAALVDRVGIAEAAAAESKSQLGDLQQQLSMAAGQTAERERLENEIASLRASNEATIAQLHVELSDARLRADDAFQALHELNEEFISFRDVTLRQQTTMNSLADRLARANSSLGNRSATPEDSAGQ